MIRLLIRAPDHLGDGVMALPAITALVALHPGETALLAPRWGSALYGHLAGLSVLSTAVAPPQAEAVVLLKPSWGAAWRHRGASRRTGLATAGRWLLLTHAVVPGARHRVADFARVAQAAGASLSPDALPVFPTPPPPPGDAESRTILLLPGTASDATVRWRGFAALADLLGARVAFTGGPGEEGLLERLAAGRHRVVPPLSLSAFAALSVRVAAVVGNDSGLTHLAAAARRSVGREAATVHVVCGSTDPARTAAPGATAWTGLRPPCWPCYRKRCPWAAPCLHADPGPIAARLVRT